MDCASLWTDQKPRLSSGLAARLQSVPTGSIKTRSVNGSQVSGLSIKRTLEPSWPLRPNSAMRGPTIPKLRKAEAAPGPPLKTKVTGRAAAEFADFTTKAVVDGAMEESENNIIWRAADLLSVPSRQRI